MNLLSKRFERPLDYKSFFGIDSSDKVWGKLYDYRSHLAHGDEPDFGKRFKILQKSANAIKFLKEASKLLIKLALAEPQLISDLKQC